MGARPASRGAHGRRTRLTRTRDTTGTAGCADLRAVEHTDGAHGSRGGRTRDTTGTAGCGSVSRSFSTCAKQSSISHHTFLVSLKGSVSPMRETPRATGSIASDCFSETRVAQKAADCQPAKPSSLSRLALGVALSPGAYHGTASSHAPHGRKTHSHTQSVCG